MNKTIITIILIVGIIFVGTKIGERITQNDQVEAVSAFNETIIDAAEVYMQQNIDKFSYFSEVGDVIDFTVDELKRYGVLDKDLEHPLDKDLTDVKVRLVIENDSTIRYEVID